MTVLDLVMVMPTMKSMLSFVNIWLMLKQARTSNFTILDLKHRKSSLPVTWGIILLTVNLNYLVAKSSETGLSFGLFVGLTK